jgi:hypothetical protein
VTTQPERDAGRRLHQRLTVALAAAPERARVVAAFRDQADTLVVDAEAVARRAEELAAERSSARVAQRARLDTVVANALHDADAAAAHLDELRTARMARLDGAEWALATDGELPGHAKVVAAAMAALEARQHEQRTARQNLERVLEQRSAVAAATDEADRQLAELVGVGMDETGLRRELEASGQAVRDVQDGHSSTLARIQELESERAEIEHRAGELRDLLATVPVQDRVDPTALAAVRAALEAYEDEAVANGFDQRAKDLADAFTDLAADLAEVVANAPAPPDEDELRRAEALAEQSGEVLARLDDAARSRGITAEERTELDAAHAAVQAAEEAAQRRLGGGAARKRLDAARAHEQELLEGHGFSAYLDVVLRGGRVDGNSTQRLDAERAYVAACAERDRLRAALEASFGAIPELTYLETERLRLIGHAAEVLHVDPAELEGLVRAGRPDLARDLVELLRGHPLVSTSVSDELRRALVRAGVPISIEVPLAEAAAAWLGEHRHEDVAVATSVSVVEVEAELTVLADRAGQLADELADARRAEADAADQLEAARRSVGAFEAELSVRASEDEQRIHRFAAAEQLRNQVSALAATLTRAEHDAREALERATDATGAAELTYDRAQAALAELGRKARRLAVLLPADQRPEGEPLATLTELAERLRNQADDNADDLEVADAAVATARSRVTDGTQAAHAAGTGREGALAVDRSDALVDLVATPAALLVLDDPCADVGADGHARFCELVVTRSVEGHVLLLSEDAAVLGWAIELPADVATILPAHSLLNLAAPGADTQEASGSTTPSHRWAGRR